MTQPKMTQNEKWGSDVIVVMSTHVISSLYPMTSQRWHSTDKSPILYTILPPPPHCVHTHTNSPDNNTHAGKSQTTPLGWANPFISPSTFFANEYHYPGLATAYSLCTVGLDWIINRIVSHRNETHSPPPHTGGKIPPTRYHLWCEIPTTVNSFAGQLPSGFQWLAEKSPCQYSQLRLSHPFQNLATSMLNIPSVI